MQTNPNYWFTNPSNINKSILVRNSITEQWSITTFIKYDPSTKHSFIGTGHIGWKYARLYKKGKL